MGRIKNTQTDQIIILRTVHTLGRHSGSVITLLDDPSASRLHAYIQWTGTHWEIRDSSSNGSWINQQKLGTGHKCKLKPGDLLQFGSGQGTTWQLLCDLPPKSLLVPIKHEADDIELDGMVALPSDQMPVVTLYQLRDGSWIWEDSSDIKKLENGHLLEINDQSWCFIDASPVENTLRLDTKQADPIRSVRVRFVVSQNEEHVSMQLFTSQLQLDLGERVHHYLLLILARKRVQDQQAGVEMNEQGWYDKDVLCQQTGMDEKHINLQIYRLRKQLVQTQPSALELLQIVERRRGELRFAFNQIEVEGGQEIQETVN
jgi:hypothetical protein